MSNLDLWNSVADIDPEFTKPITGRPYKGTSPNPQYLIKLATEKLGPVGKGFGWKVLAEGFEPLFNQTLHWCRIEFWWIDPFDSNLVRYTFEQYGQTKAAYVTRDGTELVDEDAPKKSLTDAIVKSLSQLGFAGNIFLGRWDDQKYVDNLREEFRRAERADAPPPPAEDIEKQLVKITTITSEAELMPFWKSLPSEMKTRQVQDACIAQKDIILAGQQGEEREPDSADDDRNEF